jgi:hypothetical protein
MTSLAHQGSEDIRKHQLFPFAPETSKVPVVSGGTTSSFDSYNTPKSIVKTSGTNCTWRRRKFQQGRGHPKTTTLLRVSQASMTSLAHQGSEDIRKHQPFPFAPETSKVPVVSGGTTSSFDLCSIPKNTVKTSGTDCTWRRLKF